MILAFDTYYFDNKAKTVCIAFDDWSNEENYQVFSEITEGIEEYVPGEFYKRELPCIISLINKLNFSNIDLIIVDGFAFLDDEDRLGLGGHLYEHLNGIVPIIGVAKTNFATVEKNKRELFRGTSLKPLYISTIGVDLEEATTYIANMNGPNRIPTLLKLLDTFTKQV